MAWRFSTGLTQAILAGDPQSDVNYMADTISMGDGDGAGGLDTINDSASGLGDFAVHDYVLIQSADANNNAFVKVVSAAAGKLEVPAGSFAAISAGTIIGLIKIDSNGTIKEIFKNSTIDVFSQVRPSDADQAEPGTSILSFTKDGNAFTAGNSLNGLNMGVLDGNTMKRAIDPETGATENWKGDADTTATAQSCCWYTNDKITGASVTAKRMYGVVATSGGDLNMANGTNLTSGVPAEVTDVSFTVEAV